MKIPCDVILDLLPLYHDGACSDSSRKILEEHLSECESCKSILDRIENNTVDKYLQKEREEVVRHHTQAVKKKSFIVGISIASVLAIPILVTMIVNLVTDHALDWFFIVLTSLMTLAAVIVVPLVVEKEKLLWTLGSFTTSLSLLLLTCAIYSGGDWYFVAMSFILFGLSILFAPYILSRLPLTGSAGRHKGLLVLSIDTLLLFVIITSIGLYVQNSTWLSYWRPALLITPLCLLLPWGLFFIIRYIKADSFVKTGLCVSFSGLFLSLFENILYWITDDVLRLQLANANLTVWNNSGIINANVFLLTLLTGCIIGGIFIAIGLSRKRKS